METRKVLSLLLALVLTISMFAGCNKETAESSPSPENSKSPAESSLPGGAPYEPANKSLTIGIPADPKYWDPWSDFNNGRRDTIPILYQTLASYAPDLENNETIEYLVLASGYEKISDNVYEVTVREGIYDTDGNPFKASDAVFCLDMAREKGIWAELNVVSNIEAVSEYTLRFTTIGDMTVGAFQNILTNFPMVTQKAYEDSADTMITTPVGTTGYVLKEYVGGSHVIFEKADKYWNDAANESKNVEDGYCPWFDCTKLDTIRFEFITDTSAMAIALESGSIDLSSNVSIADSEVLLSGKNAANFSFGSRPGNTYCLSFNVTDASPTSNYNLRMALALAVDSEGLLDAIFDGKGTTLNAWSYPTYNDYQDSWDTGNYFEYDLTKAKEYLDKFYKETGTTASTLKLRLLNQSGSPTGKIAEAIQAYIVSLVGNSNCVEIINVERTVYESMWEQEDAFDILLLYNQSVSRTTSAYAWERNANAAKIMSGDDLWHSGDKQGQTLLHEAISEKTNSDATVAAFQAYINEQAYMKALMCGDIILVGKSWISGLDNCAGYKDALAVLTLDYDWAQSGK